MHTRTLYTPLHTLTFILRRARLIYAAEGIASLARRGLAFGLGMVFFRKVYYVYADPVARIQAPGEADFKPKVDDYVSKVVTSNEEADELEAQGFEFRSQVAGAAKRLDKGAMALCTFVGRELACIEWLAMTQPAHDSLGEPPYSVRFSHNEAFSGGLWTNPRYRRLGLRRYSSFKALGLLQENGIETTRTAIAKDNVAAQTSRPAFLPGPCAEGRYLRILWWRSWKEMPLAGDMQ